MESSEGKLSPIAIVGLAVRLPGKISTPEQFWNLLINKKDGRCRVPADRYNVDGFHDGNENGQQRVASDHGYFLDHVNLKACDTSFFSTRRSEAEVTDPQQRLLLEVAWECIESAGQTDLRGTDTGVFVGAFGEDWHNMQHRDEQTSSAYRVLSAGDYALANRLSYELDFRSPSMTIRTACSASLSGLHLACQALRSGDCGVALVAGSSIIMDPAMTLDMSQQGVLSPSGSCKTFDAAADGFARGEAVNAVLIKPLDKAIRDGDAVRAIIRSTAVNSDGKTSHMGSPSTQSQVEMIRRAYQAAGIDDFTQTPFFECHGTGTPVGDPLEVAAVGAVFGGSHTYIGSVKPNVGHGEGASGLTSIIKAVLALENKTIPPNINFSMPNPSIPFGKYNLEVPIEAIPWPENRLSRISVNSFGIGGANAHVILESACSPDLSTGMASQPLGKPWPRVLPVTANSTKSLQTRIQDLTTYLEHHPERLDDLTYSMSCRRAHLAHRSFCVVKDGAIGPLDFSMAVNTSLGQLPEDAKRPVYLFTGQGAQWVGMARSLVHESESFRQDIREMDETLQALRHPPSWKMEDMLRSEDGFDNLVNVAEYAQPLCTAIQVALVNFLARFGVKPGAVVGHSSGEIAAAYAAGGLSKPAAITCAYLRGQAMRGLEDTGRMAAIGLNSEAVQKYLCQGAQVACENSPESVTISGEPAAVENTLKAIKEKEPDCFSRMLRVHVAYHSDQMRNAGAAYEEHLSTQHVCGSAKLHTPMYSTVTGQLINDEMDFGPTYWRTNLESPVLFYPAMKKLLHEMPETQTLIEIGPHSALQGPVRQIIQEHCTKQPLAYLASLERDGDALLSMLNALGQLWAMGHVIDLASINPAGSLLTDLPPYPWDHDKEFWNENKLSKAWRHRDHAHHELLGSRCPESNELQMIWRNALHESDVPWLRDHRVGGNVVFPCAGFIALMGEAIKQVTGSESYALRNMIIKGAVVLQQVEATEMLTTLRPTRVTELSNSTSWYEIVVATYNGQAWVEKCVAEAKASDELLCKTRPIPTYARHISPDTFYERTSHLGLKYGPSFQGVHEISTDMERYVASASVEDRFTAYRPRYAVHPTAIDLCLQTCAIASCRGITRHIDTTMLPVDIRHVLVRPVASLLRVEAIMDPVQTTGQVTAVAKDGGAVSVNMIDIKGIPFDTGDAPDGNEVGDLARLEWLQHIDHCAPGDLIRRRPISREAHLRLERLASLFLLQTLDTVADLDVVPLGHLAKYVAWMEHEKQRMLRDVEGYDGDLAMLGVEERRTLIETLMDIVEASGDEIVINIIKICCDGADQKNIVPMFRGELTPLQTLVDDRLVDIYRYQARFVHTDAFFRLCGHAQPNMKVIEIGAGTGSMTEIALSELESEDGIKMYSQYTFTDISPGFFEAAKERFKSKRGLEYRVLDIARDPIEQGFEAGSYDLVIADNVLHATHSLNGTLRNVRKLLRDGGRLYLRELAHPRQGVAVPLIMGRLEGWWMGEHDDRPDLPFVTMERWDRELRDAGFSGTDLALLDEELEYRCSAHMISRALPSAPLHQPERETVILLFRTERIDFGQKLARILEEAGFLVEWRRLGDGHDARSGRETIHILSLIELEGPFFEDLSETDHRLFITYLRNCESGILWLTRLAQFGCTEPGYGAVNGMARTVRVELSIDMWTAELESLDSKTITACLDLCRRFCARKPRQHGQDNEFLVRGGAIFVARYHWSSLPKAIRPKPNHDASKQLEIGQYGLLNSLRWVQNERGTVKADEVEIDVRCVGLNFRDIMVAMGIVQKPKDSLGLEATGVVTRVGSSIEHVREGDRVFAVYDGLLATRRTLPGCYVAKIFETLSLEEAATLPVVYLTAIYAIVTLGQMQKGQSILIHSATGGVGQAAMNICQTLGIEMYVTVGNDEKAAYLTETHGVPRERIFDSHSTSFYDGVMQATDGRGVDVVLNSLSGELLQASWRCVAKCGKMMEIGKRDMLEHGKLALDVFQQNRTFYGIDMEALITERPAIFQGLVNQLLQWSSEQVAKPILPIHKFPLSKITDAFRFMKAGTHIGKIVISVSDDIGDEIKAVGAPKATLFSSTGTYLLVGGLGGLGMPVARWMMEKGAMNFVFLSRSAGHSQDTQSFLDELRSQGCQAIAVAGSVVNGADVQRAVDAAPTPIAGVLQLSMVLKDFPVLEMSYDDWVAGHECKVKGTWNIHRALSGTELDFFILMSSISGATGHPGQANYASGNTFLDSFVQYRHGLGLPCSVIDLGGVEGIGFLSGRSDKLNMYRNYGLRLLHEQHVVDAIQLAVARSVPIGKAAPGPHEPLVIPSHIVVGLNTSRSLADPKNRLLFRGDLRVGMYDNIPKAATDEEDGDAAGQEDELRQLLAEIEENPSLLHDAETLTRVSLGIGRVLFNFLLLPEENLEISLTLTSIGVDSLVCVEIRNWWRKILGLEITVLEITNAGTIEGLGRLAIASMKDKYGVVDEDEGGGGREGVEGEVGDKS